MSMFGPDIPKLELNGRVLTLVDASSATSSSVDIGPDISGAVASWASFPASQAVNMNSQSVTNAGSINFGSGSLATLTYDADGTRLTTPTGTALTLRTGATNALQVSGTGQVGIGKTPGYSLDINGDFNATGSGTFRNTLFTNSVGPLFNNSYTCGQTSFRWSAVNTVNLNATGSVNAASVTTTGGINANGEIIVTGNGYTSVNDVNNPFVRVKSGTDGIGAMFWDRGSNKLVFNTNFNAYPIRLEGSQVETAGNIQCGGSVEATAQVALRETGSAFGQGTVIKLRGNTNADAYQIEYNHATTTSPNALDVRLVGASDGANNRNFDFGYYTGDVRSGAWNSRVKVNTYNGDTTVSGKVLSVAPGDANKQFLFWYDTATDKGIVECVHQGVASKTIRLGGSQVETAGNIECGGNITARAFYTTTALTGTVSQNGFGALFAPPETGAYLFSAYLTSAPGTANIAGMIFIVSGVVTRVSTQFATLMTATAPDLGTSLLIQNLSSTASPMRISVQRFGL